MQHIYVLMHNEYVNMQGKHGHVQRIHVNVQDLHIILLHVDSKKVYVITNTLLMLFEWSQE